MQFDKSYEQFGNVFIYNKEWKLKKRRFSNGWRKSTFSYDTATGEDS